MEYTAQSVVVEAQPVYPGDPPAASRHSQMPSLAIVRYYGAPYMGVGVGCAWFFALLFLIITMRAVFGGRSPVYDNCGDTRTWADDGIPQAALAYDTLVKQVANVSAQLFYMPISQSAYAPVEGAVINVAKLTSTLAPSLVTAGGGSAKCSFDSVSDLAWIFGISVPSNLPIWHTAQLMMLNVSYMDPGTNVSQSFGLLIPPYSISNPNALFSSGCRIVNVSTTTADLTLYPFDEAYTCDWPFTGSSDTYLVPNGVNQTMRVVLRPNQGAYETVQNMFKGSGIVYSGDGSDGSGSYSGTSIFVGFVATLACMVGACALSSMYLRHRRTAVTNADQYSTIHQEPEQEMNQQYY